MPSDSLSVGTSLKAGLRCGAITARLTALPASIMALASGTEQVTMSMPPAARSCIAGPKGLPDAIANRLTAELKKAYDSAEFQDFMKNRGFGTTWADPAGFAKFMADGDRAMGTAMTAAGLAKKA